MLINSGSTVVSMMNVVDSVKVLSLSGVKLCLDEVINLLKCFPHLEKLYIKVNPCAEVLCICMFHHLFTIMLMTVFKLS